MTSAGISAVRSFEIVSQVPPQTMFISGVTRDAAGAALPSCSVTLFRTADGSIAAQGIISDAAGRYSIAASPSIAHFLVAYKAGSPDVSGTSINTLVGS